MAMALRIVALTLGLLALAALGTADPVATGPDTTLVLGGPDRWDGRFETPDGQPAWHGWTHADLYGEAEGEFWHVSDHLPLVGEYSAWCGTWYENECQDGYGNGWVQVFAFRGTPPDPAVAVTVRWQAVVRVDSEPGYDYLHVQAARGAAWEDLVAPVDGQQTFQLDQAITFQPEDYTAGEWSIRFLAQSDGAWSDEDCLWDTQGFARVDDIVVTMDGVVVCDEDFEDGHVESWRPLGLPLVGDFTQLWSGLDDLDPDHQNDSWQVAFIDDGLVVPGTGGTPCQSWCYGPDGWAFNVTAGLCPTGAEGNPFGWYNGGVWNGVVSPVLSWPAGADLGEMAFDVYAHMQYYECGVHVYGWTYRAIASEDPADLENAPWQPTRWSLNHPELMPVGPAYARVAMPIGPLAPGVRWLQVRLEATEAGPWCWGWYVWDPTPAPYFDNVAVRAWSTATDAPPEAPVLSLRAAPNPFNPRVTLRFAQPLAGPVDLAIYDARGRLVRRLLRADRPAGEGAVVWDGRDDAGRGSAAGVYLARLVTVAGTERLKLTLVR
jgi:hypothetical protein